LRYEYFGMPSNTDRSKDVNFYFGPGSTIKEQLESGSLRPTNSNPGSLQGLLYHRDLNNFAPSIGLAWGLFGRGNTVLRAGYDLAFDRVFDTAKDVRTNSLKVVTCFPPECSLFLIPAERMLPLLNQDLKSRGPGADIVQLDENLQTPYAQNWYLGVQHSVT